ncbi:MAG TPA: response regulator transcription factor [Thermoleophilaceae bacterium]|nr:response regulator transcription factor [Thermoleophilaceae bacterium]
MRPTNHTPRDVPSSGGVIPLHRAARDRLGSARGVACTRVLIAEKEALVRAGLRAILQADPGIAVVGQAAAGDEAVDLVERLRPDVVLIATRLTHVDGVEAARRILANPDLAEVKVLMLTPDERDGDLIRALRAGACGVLVNDSDALDLRHAVAVVAEGGAQLSPSMARRLLDELAAAPAVDPRLPGQEALAELTPREREVLTLVAKGLTNAEIAERLVVSPATAKTHVSRAMVKLKVSDRAKLVTIAYEAGLIRPRSRDEAPRPGAPRLAAELVAA